MVTTGSGNDFIFAGDGNDTVAGGVGNDTIFGGTGVDVLAGGNGADIFGFASGDTGISVAVPDYDTITDFTTGTDKIDIATVGSFVSVNGAGIVAVDEDGSNTLNAGDTIILMINDTAFADLGPADFI